MVEVMVHTEPLLHLLQLHLGVEEEVVEEVVDQEEVEVVVDQELVQQNLIPLDIIDQEFHMELLAWGEVMGEVVEEGVEVVEEGVEGVEDLVVDLVEDLVEDLHQVLLGAAAPPAVEGIQMLLTGPTS
jgi:hypothetical protein